MIADQYMCSRKENHLRAVTYFTLVLVAMQQHLFFAPSSLFVVKCSIDAQQDLVVFAHVHVMFCPLFLIWYQEVFSGIENYVDLS